MKTETILNIKELRIGNLIYDGNATVEVYNIMDKGESTVINCSILDGDIDLYIENPTGIEITTEWILKLGGYKYNRGYDGRYDLMGYIVQPVDNSDNKIYALLVVHDDGVLEIAQLNYIHQLQNLMFALTGEELTIKK